MVEDFNKNVSAMRKINNKETGKKKNNPIVLTKRI